MSTILFESCPIWCIKISKTDIIRHQKVKDLIAFFNVKPPSNIKAVVRLICLMRINPLPFTSFYDSNTILSSLDVSL